MRKKGSTRNVAGASVTGGTLELTITGAPQVAAAHHVTRLELLCHAYLRTHTY